MSGDLVIQIGQEALMIVIIVAAPMLGLGLTVGLMVSVFQATTSIQEQTLAFIPKIIAVFVAILVFGPWMLRIMVEFFTGIFVNLSDAERPETQEDVSTFVLIPAFMISELKTGFQIGFMIYVPFIVIDMIVATTLMSMGMMMLPPVMISLPFKILLFVMIDGWHLLINSIIVSFR